MAIETVLTLRLVFHQPLRQTKGFVSSVLAFMDLDLPVPDHTTISRRAGGLVRSRPIARSKESLDLVVDSTGLKIYGPGEWRQERFGEGQPRRALVETTMSRYKRIIAPGPRPRDPHKQHTETMIGVDVLNHMFAVGRPVTERIG